MEANHNFFIYRLSDLRKGSHLLSPIFSKSRDKQLGRLKKSTSVVKTQRLEDVSKLLPGHLQWPPLLLFLCLVTGLIIWDTPPPLLPKSVMIQDQRDL